MGNTDTGQVTGTADKDYNIIWFTEACLSDVLRLETYIGDARRAGDDELAEFFVKAQADSRRGRRARQSTPGVASGHLIAGSLRRQAMAVCEVCGNDYDKSFEVIAAGATHTFDSFECAVHLMAPVCEHCSCKVIGHGIEVEGHFYCCAHCARHELMAGEAIQDRA